MNDTRSTLRYPGFRFPAEIIGHAVWLYHRFTLSFRDIEDLLAKRGIIVTHKTIRQWCLRFGQEYANSIRRRRPQPGDKWHLDEVFIKVCGETHYLWRAVDQNGNVLDILVQSQRNAKAATRFFKKLLKGLLYAPRVMITDKPGTFVKIIHRIIPIYIALTPKAARKSRLVADVVHLSQHDPVQLLPVADLKPPPAPA
jgi:putative transposase